MSATNHTRDKAHAHRFDKVPNQLRAACQICGFAVPLYALTSKVNLDAITARANATPELQALLAEAMAVKS